LYFKFENLTSGNTAKIDENSCHNIGPQRCVDCGVVNDVRLMPAHCHMEKAFVHGGSVVQFHPKQTERFHDSNAILKEHPGGLYRPWYTLGPISRNSISAENFRTNFA
jgi:hypothetical protein